MQEKKMKIISGVLAAVLCGACLTSCGGQAAVSSEYMGESSSAVASEPESKPESKPMELQNRLEEFTEADAEAANARRSGTAECTLYGESLNGNEVFWRLKKDLMAQYGELLWYQVPVPKTAVVHFADIPGLEMQAEIMVHFYAYDGPRLEAFIQEITFGGKSYNLARDFPALARVDMPTGGYGWEIGTESVFCKNGIALTNALGTYRSDQKYNEDYNGGVVIFEGGYQDIRGLDDIACFEGRPYDFEMLAFDTDEAGRLLCYRTISFLGGDDNEKAYIYIGRNMPPETVVETMSVLTVENGKLKEKRIHAYNMEQYLRENDGLYVGLVELYQCSNYIELGQKLEEKNS